MSRTVTFAAVQMNAEPAPAEARLGRASALVAQAAEQGARLIALPEVFNTGYEYSDTNYSLAETLNGPTVAWMKQMAAQHHIYLVGTLLLLDTEDIYNAMLLVSPEGQIWRYNKVYPWAWERAYFRDGEYITVAETSLGKLGMLVCWDMAHPGVLDEFANAMLRPVYRRAVRKVHGTHMAPVTPQTRRWAVAVALAALVGVRLGRRLTSAR